MNTFEIKENGRIILNDTHQGNCPNSSSYYYYAFAKYALEKLLGGRGSSLNEVYWHNGREEWSLKELNLVANYMGIDKFFLSLWDNNGGATYKYDQIVLKAISRDGDGNLMGYPPEESLEFLHSIGYRSKKLYSTPVFQKAGEEGYYKIAITDDGVFEEWVDFEY